MVSRWEALALLLLCSGGAQAGVIDGRVVAIADGDTITVLDGANVRHTIRLAGIDAPEKRQPFGEKSRQHLVALVFQADVVVVGDKVDRYGRTVGKVLRGRRDAGLRQIKSGLAWHYKAYEGEQSPLDRSRYAAAEMAARAAGRGLWRDRNATPPWEWRHQGKRDAFEYSPASGLKPLRLGQPSGEHRLEAL